MHDPLSDRTIVSHLMYGDNRTALCAGEPSI